MLKIAHRGAKGYALENTIAAFAKAIELHADGVELDVHLTADGKVAVIHDHTLDRTTRMHGEVREKTMASIRQLTGDPDLQVPELSDVFDFIDRRCMINVELKVESAARPVVDLIEFYVSKGWAYNDFLVSSFDWNALTEIRRRNPEIPLGVLVATGLDLAIAFSNFLKAETIHPYFHLLSGENVNQMQLAGFRVFAWTVNEPSDIEMIKAFGVDGIISDFPDRL